MRRIQVRPVIVFIIWIAIAGQLIGPHASTAAEPHELVDRSEMLAGAASRISEASKELEPFEPRDTLVDTYFTPMAEYQLFIDHSEVATPHILGLMASTHPRDRCIALELDAKVNGRKAVLRLVAHLNDTDYRVRYQAMTKFQRIFRDSPVHGTDFQGDYDAIARAQPEIFAWLMSSHHRSFVLEQMGVKSPGKVNEIN